MSDQACAYWRDVYEDGRHVGNERCGLPTVTNTVMEHNSQHPSKTIDERGNVVAEPRFTGSERERIGGGDGLA